MKCNFQMTPHVRPLVGWMDVDLVGLLVGLWVIISLKDGKLLFHAPFVALVFAYASIVHNILYHCHYSGIRASCHLCF